MTRRVLLIVLSVLTTIGLIVGGTSWWTLRQLDAIPRFDASESSTILTPEVDADDSISSFLLFSVGSYGLAPGEGQRLGIGRGRAAMADGLTDSIMLILSNPKTGQIGVVSIPRDTWIAERGRRINAAYNAGGLSALLDDVELLTGIRPQHQVALNFAAFADAVDAAGGVDIEIPFQVKDQDAKLLITEPGCVHLSGVDALAFSRARHWRISDDGISWRNDATSSDWGRVDRQQAIVRAIIAKISGPQFLTSVPSLLGAAQRNLILDPGLTTGRLITLANAWRHGVNNLSAATYPGVGFTTDAGASVIGPSIFEGKAIVTELAAAVGFPIDGVIPVSAVVTDSSTITSTTANGSAGQGSTPTAAAAPTTSASPAATRAPAWRPATNGSGLGGTKYPVCSDGHAPRL